jgi:hypothetical protein
MVNVQTLKDIDYEAIQVEYCKKHLNNVLSFEALVD